MGCINSRVGPAPPPNKNKSGFKPESRFSRFKKLFKSKKTTVPEDKTTVFVAIDHSGKLSQKLEPKKKKEVSRRSCMQSVMADPKSLRLTPFGFSRGEVMPPIEKEEEVEVTVVYTVRESQIIINPDHVCRDDGFRVIERTFLVPKSDKSARRIVNGLRVVAEEDAKKKRREEAEKKKMEEEQAKKEAEGEKEGTEEQGMKEWEKNVQEEKKGAEVKE